MSALTPYPARPTTLGDLPIWRALPLRNRRMIGAWCFLDRYGPLSFSDGRPMDVAAHPHIGIETVSYLLDGEVVHHDSLGYEALLRPGGVNVMSSGSGIAHAEVTPSANSGRLNGVQLWIALPNDRRNAAPSFTHIKDAGETFIDRPDLIGSDVRVERDRAIELNRSFEHGLLLLDGEVETEGQRLDAHTLYYLEPGRSEVAFRSNSGARVLLLGGPPFPEKIVMWWNFVARTADEIRAAREDWQAGRRFGEVRGYSGPRLHAPDLAQFAPANPAS